MNTAEEKKNQNISEYLLLNYMISEEMGKKALEKALAQSETEIWNQWHRVILLETDQDFFDSRDEYFLNGLRRGIGRDFYYLNLTARQSLLFFTEMNCDYMLIAKKVMDYLKQCYTIRVYLAVSKNIYAYQELPSILRELNSLLDEKYYFPDKRFFVEEDEEQLRTESESQDSQIMQRIADDVWKRNGESLWEHYHILEEKYRDSRRYSAMYVKFVFSGVVEELCQDKQFGNDNDLVKEISKIYCCNNMSDIQKITKENIQKYQEYLGVLYTDAKRKIPFVKSYIQENCKERLDIEEMADKVELPAGLLGYVFKKQTGENLVEYIHHVRLSKGRDLLCTTDYSMKQISKEIGIATEAYFKQCFYRRFGSDPEKYRSLQKY